LHIEASVHEPNGLHASLDASKVIQGATSLAPESCTQQGTDWLCMWDTTEIDMGGYIANYLVFNFTDAAGNSEIYQQPIIVLEPKNVETDYWDVALSSPSPAAIDRELVNLYDPFIWYTLELVPKEGAASTLWPVDIKVDSCTGDSAKYLASTSGNIPEVSNFNPSIPGSFPYRIYLKYVLERTSPDQDSLDINCTLKIKTLVDGTAISQAETKYVTVTITYYNNPLGTLDKNVVNEINQTKNSWLVKADWLELAQTILGYANLACSVMDQLKNIQKMLAFAKDGFSNCCTLYPNSFCCTAAQAQGKTTVAAKEATDHAWFGEFNRWCKLLSCRFGQDEQNGKWAKTNIDFIDSILGYAKDVQSKAGTKQGYWGNVDPQHSLVLSVATLCLPGVIYNLQKARAIDCNYVQCLQQTKDGMPLYMCVDQRAYAYCKFVWGEIFNAIPFASAIGQIGQNIQKALSHPFELIGFSIKAFCTATCLAPFSTGQGCMFCTIADYLNIAMDVMCDLGIGNNCQPIWSSLQVDDSVCKQVLGTSQS